MRTVGGTTFEDIDISEARTHPSHTHIRSRMHARGISVADTLACAQGEWTEYDEKAGESVSIMELTHEFKVHREK